MRKQKREFVPGRKPVAICAPIPEAPSAYLVADRFGNIHRGQTRSEASQKAAEASREYR